MFIFASLDFRVLDPLRFYALTIIVALIVLSGFFYSFIPRYVRKIENEEVLEIKRINFKYYIYFSHLLILLVNAIVNPIFHYIHDNKVPIIMYVFNLIYLIGITVFLNNLFKKYNNKKLDYNYSEVKGIFTIYSKEKTKGIARDETFFKKFCDYEDFKRWFYVFLVCLLVSFAALSNIVFIYAISNRLNFFNRNVLITSIIIFIIFCLSSIAIFSWLIILYKRSGVINKGCVHYLITYFSFGIIYFISAPFSYLNLSEMDLPLSLGNEPYLIYLAFTCVTFASIFFLIFPLISLKKGDLINKDEELKNRD